MAAALWRQPLNAVLGDSSFVEVHGRSPGPWDTDRARIEAHLLAVARRLRSQQDVRRHASAARLEAYAVAGVFPRHLQPPKTRTPIFVDRTGTACAVGHLMRVSGAADLCKKLDAAHHSCRIDEVLATGDPELVGQLLAWAESQGLAASDLALIQPTYTAAHHVLSILTCAGAFLGSALSLAMGAFGAALVFVAKDRSGPLMALAIGGTVQVVLLVSMCLATLLTSCCRRRAADFLLLLLAMAYSWFLVLALPTGIALLGIATKDEQLRQGPARKVIIAAWTTVGSLLLFCACCVALGSVDAYRGEHRARPLEPETDA